VTATSIVEPSIGSANSQTVIRRRERSVPPSAGTSNYFTYRGLTGRKLSFDIVERGVVMSPGKVMCSWRSKVPTY